MERWHPSERVSLILGALRSFETSSRVLA